MPIAQSKSHQIGRAVLAAAAFLAAIGTISMCADGRIAIAGAETSTAAAVRQAMRSGPVVAPVGRMRPKLPPWPTALVAAGDIVPPVLAPEMAPLPVRRDAAAARAFLLTETSALAEAQAADATRTALTASKVAAPARASEQ